MFKPSDISSLSDFQRSYNDHIEHLRTTRRPELLTRNGKAVLVVQDPDAYQELLDKVEEAEAILSIHRSLQEADRGELTPIGQSLFQVRERLGIHARAR